MKNIYLCLVFFLISSIVKSQSILSPTVIATAGGVSKFSSIELEWTLGESFIGTASSPVRFYTVGFHQPSLIIQKIISENEIYSTQISLYPNPVKSILTVQLRLDKYQKTKLILSDILGRPLQDRTVIAKIATLNLPVNNLIAGIYFLKIFDTKGNPMGSYKIIKAN